MRTLIIHNCATESIGFYKDYLIENKIEYLDFPAYSGIDFPELTNFDSIMITGTPISVNDLDKHEFLIKEKEFLKKTIGYRKPHLGICFGSQILAKIIGAEVKRNPIMEIGVNNVVLTEEGKKSEFLKGFPSEFNVFQWHSDTFNIPNGGKLLIKGVECTNQCFSYENNIGFQFHLEVDSGETSKWADNYGDQLIIIGKTKDQIVQECRQIEKQMKELANILMDNFFNKIKKSI
jgi:GMP synthase (glutamine-hydrolysing)